MYSDEIMGSTKEGIFFRYVNLDIVPGNSFRYYVMFRLNNLKKLRLTSLIHVPMRIRFPCDTVCTVEAPLTFRRNGRKDHAKGTFGRSPLFTSDTLPIFICSSLKVTRYLPERSFDWNSEEE
jgi:hypothetical protein